MEQLRQRVVATYQLKPLNEEETKSYILFRLKKAGWQNSPQFEDEVFSVICSYTQGIPRRINTLCDRVLLFGYLDELTVINLAAIQKVITDVEEEASAINDEFNDEPKVGIDNELANTLEKRVAALEQIVITFRQALNRSFMGNKK
jgi:hypothetical protein